MAQPSWQRNFNTRQSGLMNTLMQGILSGDPARINATLNRSELRASGNPMSVGIHEYAPVLRQIAQDYMNFGGVSPQTRAAIQGMRPGGGGGFTHSGAERESGANAAHRIFSQLARALPQVTSVGGDTQVRMLGLPPGMNQQDYIQQYLTNQALQYMDPSSRQETQQYLARTNPGMFRAYGMMQGGPTAPTQDTVDPAALRANIQNFANSMDFGRLSRELTPNLGGASLPAASSSMNWLQDYLRTAMGGMGGTRAQQQFSQARLGTLEREAQAKPQDLGQYLTLAENLTNPVTRRAPISGLIGGRRAVQQGSDFMRRGLVRRNPYAT